MEEGEAATQSSGFVAPGEQVKAVPVQSVMDGRSRGLGWTQRADSSVRTRMPPHSGQVTTVSSGVCLILCTSVPESIM